MEQRRFGRTGLHVPALTFGGGWVGGVLIHGTEAEAFAALDRAVEAGIDWIDTAALYGQGVSETVIGRWLQGRTDRPRISTKFRVEPGAGDFQGQMMRSVEASLQRLGLDRVEVIIQHNMVAAEAGERDLTPAQMIALADAMEHLREQDLCAHIGMTALGDPAPLAEVVDAGRFDVAQVYYNMVNPTAWQGRTPWNSTNFDGLLQRCTAQDMGVMGIRIFAAGHLATPTRHGREIPVTIDAEDAAEEARARVIWAALEDGDGAPAQAALRFGLACPALSTIVVGLGKQSHLDLAIAAEAMGPLPEGRLSAISSLWDGPAFTG